MKRKISPMKRIFQITLLALTLAFLLPSCGKPGSGGKATIRGVVQHHDDPIANAIVYIKYDAVEFPGEDVSVYDASVMADANGNYEIADLRKGDYYLFGSGFDTAINDDVIGGIRVTINDRKETIETMVPVTED